MFKADLQDGASASLPLTKTVYVEVMFGFVN